MKAITMVALLAVTSPVIAQTQKNTVITAEQSAGSALLSKQFEESKGKLKLPIDKGVLYDGTESPNGRNPRKIDGASVNATTNGTVHSVFEGNVESVFKVNESDIIVILRHGKYFTVYSGFATTAVTKGQHVSAGETLGTIAKNEKGELALLFEIWKAEADKTRERLSSDEWLKS